MEIKEFLSHEIPVTQVLVQTEQDAAALGRRPGLYITMETGPLNLLVSFENVCACLADQLRPLLGPFFGKTLCVCGVGNQAVPSDSLGPEAAKRFQPKSYDTFTSKCNFEKVAVICPGVSALTNLSTETILSGVAAAIDAACVLAIDSSVCTDAERLCSTIQLSTGGMRTYWASADLSQAALGTPVVSIGVPTAVRAANVSVKGSTDPELLLAPIQIVDVINAASFIIACAVTMVVYPELDYESCKQYIELFLHGVI